MNVEKLPNEIFVEIPNTDEGYFVSNMGRIYSSPSKSNANRRGLVLKPGKRGNGYLGVVLRKISPKSISVHRIVAMAFCDNEENKPQVNHKDGDKKNNAAANLEWVTNQENRDHATRNLPKRIHSLKERKKAAELAKALGEKKRLLTMEQAADIRELRSSSKIKTRVIANMYNVGTHVIQRILSGATYGI